MVKLIIDARERNVLRHTTELAAAKYEIKTITVGDYALINENTNEIMAIIERKSLEDYAASIKDGRHSNKEKLIDLREKTGCRIIYIIEGPAFPAGGELFGRIPYSHIESSIFHLILRDNITILKTASTIDTAATLCRLAKSAASLLGKTTVSYSAAPNAENLLVSVDATSFTADAIPITADTTPITTGGFSDESLELLTVAPVVKDIDIVRKLWSTLRGVSVESADDLIKHFSLTEVARKQITRERLATVKTAIGRALSTKVVDSIMTFDKAAEYKMLAAVPGVSINTAKAILNEVALGDLLTYTADTIAMRRTAGGKRRLGPMIAGNIKKYFDYI